MSHFKEISTCKICGSHDLTDVIHIPPQHLSATFVKDNSKCEISNIKVPMTLTLCDKNKDSKACGLLQMREEVEPDLLYRQYFYRSSVSQTMREDLLDVVKDIQSRANLKKNDLVVDIGANDFTMLGFYPDTVKRVGFEPAQNIDWSHVDESVTVINDYFNAAAFKKVFGDRKAQAFSCCAMFYDLSNPNAFVREVKELLSADGVWCIQLSYLPLMLENMNFYDICHEHLSYYSLAALESLMERNGLKVFDASTNNVNGGSLRAFVTHKENASLQTDTGKTNLARLRSSEESLRLSDPEVYQHFFTKIMDLSTRVRNFISEQMKKSGEVIGLGASTKGNVLIQLFGITREIMPRISERNPEKVGLRTMGTDILLISEDEARQRKPSSMLVLPWYFKDEIVKRERTYLDEGGTLLFPMPYAHVVTSDGEIRL